ncbi:neutral zinc metallopeptidase [Deinococcus aquaticus]|uniref:Neutral zinc metallopeptidase n=1 Tax=Deinococcus aquaticus TaxID=328692 RepID=A0ABY7V2P9_9DEIO|nr:neutral zinc metallopeptidase [Deinococcus aquaticus]WDA59000.1 neutral zinc metallopeptidase [Deinococcus aquaticus]
MDWKNLPGSGGNVEDRRGRGGLPGGGIAVGGVGGLIIALIAMFFGIDPGAILGGDTGTTQTQSQSQSAQPQADDEAYQFVNSTYRSTNQVWDGIFTQAGRTYNEPRLTLYTQGTQSACGAANSAVGPFYCPADQRIYLDTSFFTQMDRQLGGGGDFAYSYVIAHEVGHHVQNELGIADQVERKQRSARTEAEANSYSVRLELQADCFAGVWGNKVQTQAKLTQQDIREAINTAQAIGDDNLQRQSGSRVVPDSFTHGSAQQRINWFTKGFKSGDANGCDTFAVNYNQL